MYDVKIFLLFFQLLYCNQYYFSKAEPLIGDGIRHAHENEFSFVVSIGKKIDREAELNHACTGALISRSHVLTAAHCVNEKPFEALQVSIGSVDLRTADKFPVVWYYTFETFLEVNNFVLGNEDPDMAVIKLARNVDNPSIIPATLSPLNSFTAVGLSLNFAGWGEGEDERVPRYLRTVRFNVISNEEASAIYSRVLNWWVRVSSEYICTQGTPPAFASCGDSGGALFTDNHEIVAIHLGSCLLGQSASDRIDLNLSIDHMYRLFIESALLQIYGNQYYFSKAEPLIGDGIRHASENEFSFVVSIGKKIDQEAELNHDCTGALISRSHILTAAHCVDEKPLETLQVSIGSVDLRAAEKFPVLGYYTCKRFFEVNNFLLGNEEPDMAVIKLARNVDNPSIIPATLSSLNSFTAVGLSLNFAGWGKAEDDRIPRYLRTVRFNALSNEEASAIFSRVMNKWVRISSMYICTQATPPAFASCGDSGGALFTDNHEIVAIHVGSCSFEIAPDIVDLNLSIDHMYRQFIESALLL